MKALAIVLLLTGCATTREPVPYDAWSAVLCGDNTHAAWCGLD